MAAGRGRSEARGAQSRGTSSLPKSSPWRKPGRNAGKVLSGPLLGERGQVSRPTSQEAKGEGALRGSSQG